MRIDLHVHGALSKQTGFDLELMREKMAVARERGLDAILLTEHFNISGFKTIYNLLLKEFPFNGNYFEIEKIKVFPGIEVNIAEGPHLVAGGTLENVLKLNERLSDYRQKGQYCSADIYFDKQAGMELLNIFAHPTRANNLLKQLHEKYHHNFDAFEVNAKDIYLYGREVREQMAVAADKVELPVVAGSDAHHFFQLGTVFNDFHQPFESVTEIKAAIANRYYDLHIASDAEKNVAAAIEAKQVLKAEFSTPSLAEVTGREANNVAKN